MLVLLLVVVGLAGCTRDREPRAARTTTTTAVSSTTTAPSTTAPTAPVGPADGPVPKDFRVRSLTFVSESDGWALGEAPCPRPNCAAVLRTRDGGRTWAGIPAPDASELADLRFGDARNGWAFGAGLHATHDGGATWRPVALTGPVAALEAARGRVWALAGDPLRLYASAVDDDGWQPVADVDLAGARKGSIILNGDAAYVAALSSSGRGGLGVYAKAGDGWQRRTSPCPEWGGALAASAPTDLAAVCQTDEGAGGTATHKVFVSSDGGNKWTQVADLGRTSYPSLVAATTRGTFLGYEAIGEVSVTRDGGKSFQRVLELEGLADIGFTSPTQGFAVGEGAAFITRDAGAKWARIAFG